MTHTDTATLHRAARILRESGHTDLAEQVDHVWYARMTSEVDASMRATLTEKDPR